MEKNIAKPYEYASFLVQNKELVDAVYSDLDNIYTKVLEFWKTVGDIDKYHLQDDGCFKVNFGGDIFPNSDDFLVSTVGLYVDTIILPCPILKIGHLKNGINKTNLVELLLKSILSVMTYKNIALEDLDIPIVVIQPDEKDYHIDDKINLLSRSDVLLLKHAKYLFNIDFSSVDDFQLFCSKLRDVNAINKALVRKDRFVINTDWGCGGINQIEKLLEDDYIMYENFNFERSAGNSFFINIVGRFPQALAILENSRSYMSTPVITAETSWLYYNWMMGYLANKEVEPRDNKNNYIVRALSAEGRELSWLGNVPIDTIINLRKNGQLSEVRNIIGHGLDELKNINNFNNVKYTVMDNIDREFRQHQKKLNELKKKKMNLLGVDIPLCLSTGTIAVTAALTTSPMIGAIAALVGSFGLPNLIGIKSKYSELNKNKNTYESSATGVLFSHVKGK